MKIYKRILNRLKKSPIIKEKENSYINPKSKKQIRMRQELQHRQVADFYYLVDIVGTCNLRCPSCPVGNYPSETPAGLMSLDMYQSILDKIAREHPGEKIFMDLYNWGEPGLHKQLGEIIQLTKKMGYGVGISTNLNAFPDMANVIKKNPSYIRISLSGYFNEIYQQTHKRGDINIVKANMHLLRQKLDLYKSDTIVQVGFHIYRTNFEVDFWKMQQLCEDLDFIFAPTLAALMPVEKAVKVVDKIELNDSDKSILEKLVVSTEKRVELLSSLRPKYKDCQYRQVRTTINYDGSVPLCCATFEKDQIIADNFLEVSREEIQARKYIHPFCKTCQERSLDMVYTNVEPVLVEEYAISVLGDKYRQFLDEWNVSMEPVVDWEGQELSGQEAFDLASKYEGIGNISQAKELFKKMVERFPRHGDALCKLGKLHENDGDLVHALECYQSALAIWPTYPTYMELVAKVQNELHMNKNIHDQGQII